MPKKTKRIEQYGRVVYLVPEEEDIPEHLIKKERAAAKTERWRARLGL